MDILFSGGDIEQLRELFADNLKFVGPLHEFDCADDYINSLRSDPPRHFQYKIIRSLEDESSACLVYQFSKPGVCTPMAQLFEIGNGKIEKILLVFDTGAFS